MSAPQMTVAEIIDILIPRDNPFHWTAFDGSETGPADTEYSVEITSPDALAYAITAPGDLGMGRAWITGGLVVHGGHPAHPYEVFDRLRQAYKAFHKPTPKQAVEILRSLKAMGALKFLPAPAIERTGRFERLLLEGLSRHSKARDAEVISSHYDVGNDFYELVLGDSMTYTCACYPNEDATLDEAQENKLRLVFEKLQLKEGDRLLDVGCGWGTMVRYAARHGVKALGVVLSKEQAEWAQAAIEREGLSDLAEVRYQDYRDVTETDFDAISAIGLLEHIGVKNYDFFFTFLRDKLRPGGLMLNHCITTNNNRTSERGGFVDRYVFPDGELTGSGRITMAMQDAGLEVLHTENLRVHYARTLSDWCENLRANWDQAVELVGEQTARLWGMYMAGAEWNFDKDVVELHQFLGVKLNEDGTRPDNISLRPWWQA